MALARVFPDIYARIRREVDESPVDRAADEVARNILRIVSKEDLSPLIVDEINRLRRMRVRGMERGVFARLDAIAPLVALPAVSMSAKDRVDQLRSILRESFALGDGSNVTWGEATLEQHRERIRVLQDQRNGIDKTLGHHARAVSILIETGASCLDEVV